MTISRLLWKFGGSFNHTWDQKKSIEEWSVMVTANVTIIKELSELLVSVHPPFQMKVTKIIMKTANVISKTQQPSVKHFTTSTNFVRQWYI